ncbi:hypothetical protein [Nocardioides sp. HB32]
MILLGYRDRNVHELIGHAVAVRAGSYRRVGVEVRAVSGAEHPDAALSAGLGGSLVETLNGQRSWRAALVHTLHPLFWGWGRPGTSWSDAGRVAGHPHGSIVWAFTEKVLGDRGVATEALDVQRFPVGTEGDRQRLEALRAGAADVAVVGTAFAPSALERLGLVQLVFFGDEIRFPTAGVAVDTELVPPDDPGVRAVVEAQREALGLIRSQAPVAVDAALELLPGATREDAEGLLSHYLAPQYGPARTDVDAVGGDAIAWLSQVLTAAPGPAQTFYEEIR